MAKENERAVLKSIITRMVYNLSVEQIVDSIMDQVFGAGYISPQTESFCRLCTAIIESTPEAEREKIGTWLLNLCMCIKNDERQGRHG